MSAPFNRELSLKLGLLEPHDLKGRTPTHNSNGEIKHTNLAPSIYSVPCNWKGEKLRIKSTNSESTEFKL